ncbi:MULTISPECIES: hypothetical protein [Vibrio]|nr:MULTISPECIES: hypothetical protein [Vibrio]USD35602.1 hypothetical protein J8Z27_22605 [Vibrio sp. SCSIO 43186]USD72726.1 hypothetical protein J4N41_22610 [Vibrio sp. SCSIO 43139]
MTVAHQILGQSIDYLQGKLPIKSLVEQLMTKLGLKPCMSEDIGLDRVAI